MFIYQEMCKNLNFILLRMFNIVKVNVVIDVNFRGTTSGTNVTRGIDTEQSPSDRTTNNLGL